MPSAPRPLAVVAAPPPGLFPGALARLPLTPDEVAALAATASAERLVAVPGASTGRRVGTLCRILRLVDGVDGSPAAGAAQVLVEGLQRVRLGDDTAREGGLLVLPSPTAVPDAEPRPEPPTEALARLVDRVATLARRDPRVPGDLVADLTGRLGHADAFVDVAAASLPLRGEDTARLYEEWDPVRRVQLLGECLERGLGRAPEGAPDIDAEIRLYEAQLARTPVSRAARAKAHRELAHLRRSAPGSAEAGCIRNWLEWMLELPWTAAARNPRALARRFDAAADVLGRHHAGLSDVKDRVAEFLAVRQLEGSARGTALCFIGPPGTGKSSMARALARSLGRKFVHVPIGGMADERELRGAWHTQAGAMPGRILEGLHRSRDSSPVILLDEIDKVEQVSGGNAAGILQQLLEVGHNHDFVDQYLGVPFDLSQCVFLATANDPEGIPDTLLDRLEVIRFDGYSEKEKLAIARDHLIPRTRERIGLARGQLRISPGALRGLIRGYTEEAGVRQLQRMIDSLGRKAAVSVVRGGEGLNVLKSNLLELLGPAIVDEEPRLRGPAVGMATGLAWTVAGGALLPIEALAMPGAGRTIITGSIGEVMRESVQTALSFVRSHFGDIGLAPDCLESLDLHLHFPSGATPKDGPSAGTAIATALVSLLTNTRVRHDVAMSGEVSLTGAVLPVGGLRDKLLAALRAGVREVIVPARNRDEILRLPPEVRRDLRIHLAENAHDVLALALVLDGRSRVGGVFLGPQRARRSARRAGKSRRKRRTA